MSQNGHVLIIGHYYMFTNPWITSGITTDGLHPTGDGSVAIANRIYALLPR
jgi:lysophospholipase L1-like esterase